MSQPAKAQLEGLARELQQKTGAEVAVAIVRSLEGETVETYANELAERWGVGDAEDRGALLLLSIEDRQLRLEVGYGLEPIIPDGRAGQILDVMTPLLRQGDFDTAITLGVAETAQIVAGDAGVELTGIPQGMASRRRRGPSLIPWVWLAVILILSLLPRRRRRGGWHDDAVTTGWWLGNIGGRGRGGPWDSGGGGGFGGFGGGRFRRWRSFAWMVTRCKSCCSNSAIGCRRTWVTRSSVWFSTARRRPATTMRTART